MLGRLHVQRVLAACARHFLHSKCAVHVLHVEIEFAGLFIPMDGESRLYFLGWLGGMFLQ